MGSTSGAGALAAAVPFTAIVKRMLGPAADEVAEMWRDQVRVYRYGRQLKLLEKAERMAEEAGFTPQAVPPKILFPLLEGASFEDDENLHDMWAALLANASSPEKGIFMKPAFIAILKQLTATEASLLNTVYDEVEADPSDILAVYNKIRLKRLVEKFPDDEDIDTSSDSFARDDDECVFSVMSLVALRLIEVTHKEHVKRMSPHKPEIVVGDCYSVTIRGRLFMQSVRPPKPKE